MATIGPMKKNASNPDRAGGRNPKTIRLPKQGTHDPDFGWTRSYWNELILPRLSNRFAPPIKSWVIKKPGAKRGIRLIDYASALAWFESQKGDDTPNDSSSSLSHSSPDSQAALNLDVADVTKPPGVIHFLLTARAILGHLLQHKIPEPCFRVGGQILRAGLMSGREYAPFPLQKSLGDLDGGLEESQVSHAVKWLKAHNIIEGERNQFRFILPLWKWRKLELRAEGQRREIQVEIELWLTCSL